MLVHRAFAVSSVRIVPIATDVQFDVSKNHILKKKRLKRSLLFREPLEQIEADYMSTRRYLRPTPF